jgi:hypothetical protein
MVISLTKSQKIALSLLDEAVYRAEMAKQAQIDKTREFFRELVKEAGEDPEVGNWFYDAKTDTLMKKEEESQK